MRYRIISLSPRPAALCSGRYPLWSGWLTSAPSSSIRYLTDGIQPPGIARCALPANPSPYPAPAAALTGNIPGPPSTYGGKPDGSAFASRTESARSTRLTSSCRLSSEISGSSLRTEVRTSIRSSADSGLKLESSDIWLRAERAPVSRGLLRLCSGAIVGMFGSAPYLTSRRIASRSAA